MVRTRLVIRRSHRPGGGWSQDDAPVRLISPVTSSEFQRKGRAPTRRCGRPTGDALGPPAAWREVVLDVDDRQAAAAAFKGAARHGHQQGDIEIHGEQLSPSAFSAPPVSVSAGRQAMVAPWSTASPIMPSTAKTAGADAQLGGEDQRCARRSWRPRCWRRARVDEGARWTPAALGHRDEFDPAEGRCEQGRLMAQPAEVALAPRLVVGGRSARSPGRGHGPGILRQMRIAGAQQGHGAAGLDQAVQAAQGPRPIHPMEGTARRPPGDGTGPARVESRPGCTLDKRILTPAAAAFSAAMRGLFGLRIGSSSLAGTGCEGQRDCWNTSPNPETRPSGPRPVSCTSRSIRPGHRPAKPPVLWAAARRQHVSGDHRRIGRVGVAGLMRRPRVVRLRGGTEASYGAAAPAD